MGRSRHLRVGLTAIAYSLNAIPQRDIASVPESVHQIKCSLSHSRVTRIHTSGNRLRYNMLPQSVLMYRPR